ncbi:MAG: DUF4279 domain-containing protein, partial [Methyloligellaceae bacterium]
MPQEPQMYRQYAYLAITGSGPSSDITNRLGLQPDEEWSEGDAWREKPPNQTRFFTFWQLNSGALETEDLNVHVKGILWRLKRKKSEVQSLLGDYDVKLVCVSY